MASPRGPFRFDKPNSSENGGLSRYSGCNSWGFNKISADGVDTTKWWQPSRGMRGYVRPPGYSYYVPFIVQSAYSGGSYWVITSTSPGYDICYSESPAAGPITEWFVSFYDPGEEPPYDETAQSVVGGAIVDAPTTPATDIGSWCPYLEGFPPFEALYQDAAGQTVRTQIQPMGLGHLIAVNDYSTTPPQRRLYVCSEFETLDPAQDENLGSEPPFVTNYKWSPVDLDFPKIDPATNKPIDPASLFYSNNDITDLATDV